MGFSLSSGEHSLAGRRPESITAVGYRLDNDFNAIHLTPAYV